MLISFIEPMERIFPMESVLDMFIQSNWIEDIGFPHLEQKKLLTLVFNKEIGD